MDNLLGEFMGTMVLMVFGCGVNANMTLAEVEALFANMHLQMPAVDDYEIEEGSVKSNPTKTRHFYNGSIPVSDPDDPKGYRLEEINYW